MDMRSIVNDSPMTIGTRETVKRARELMVEHRLSAVPVVSGERLVGVICESDVVLPLDWPEVQRWLDELEVELLMSRAWPAVAPNASIVEIIRLMREADISCVPVIEGEQLCGMITRRTLLELLEQLVSSPAMTVPSAAAMS